jgi:hypothetical protein
MTTDTDPLDELEVPHFKDRLWDDLAELHAEHRGSEHKRRRPRRSLTVGVAAAAALVVGLVAAQLVGTSSDTPLLGRIAAATDEAAAVSIVHWVDEQTLPGEAGPSRVTEFWTDERSDATRVLHRDAQGDPVLDVGPLTGPNLESPAHSGQFVVDYCSQQYVEHRDTGGASTDLGFPDGQSLREAIDEGRWVEDGTEAVDGRDLIRLIRAEGESGAGDVLLVDPDSYLPVRMRGTMQSGESFSQTYEYVPRTSESLALLRPPVPAGFSQADPLSGDLDFSSCAGS